MDDTKERITARSLLGQAELTKTDLVVEDNPSNSRGALLWRATADLLWPWKKQTYPGRWKLASAATGYGVASASNWRWPTTFGVPPAAARRIIALLRYEIQAREQLLSVWITYERTADLKKNAAEEFTRRRENRAMFD